MDQFRNSDLYIAFAVYEALLEDAIRSEYEHHTKSGTEHLWVLRSNAKKAVMKLMKEHHDAT